TSGNKEDHVPMAMGAALKLKQVVANVERILAIEFLCAAQGMDYLRPLKAGVTVEAAFQYIRRNISHVSVDRVLSVDIERLMEIMNDEEFICLAREALCPNTNRCARREALKSPAKAGIRKPPCGC